MDFRQKAKFSGERMLVAMALVVSSGGLILLGGCSANDGAGGAAARRPSRRVSALRWSR